MEELHNYVKKFPKGRYSYQQIADKLALNAKGDFDKAKLIYLWIAENIDYDVKALNSGNFPDGSPEKTLKRKKAVCDGYARLYSAMAEYLGLEVEMINGFSKGHRDQKVSKKSDHSWNLLTINSKKILLDVTWGAGSTINNKFISKTNSYYFDTNPYEFVFDHLPDSVKFQFIDKPVSKSEFKKMPYLDKEVFINKLISGEEMLTAFRNGKEIKVPSFLSTEIEYKIIEAPVEMKIGVSYDFIIESPNGDELCYYFNNKPVKKVSKEGNSFKFSYSQQKKGQFYYAISNPDLYKDKSYPYSRISQYKIK